MSKSIVDVALPEEAAGIAYSYVKQELITPFTNWIGDNRLREHDWSLRGRIATNGEVIKDTVEVAGSDKKAILVKGPGITPTREQTQQVLDSLNDKRKPEELSKLATGTPNGYMRGHWLVKGNLERYQNPGISDLIEVVIPDYSNAGKVKTFFLDGGRYKEGQCIILDTDSDVRVEFNHRIVRETEHLTKGSPVYFKVTHKAEVENLCESAISENKEIVFMSKYTVRPNLDGEKKKIYNDIREKMGLKRLEGNQGDIVDAAFARVLAHPKKEDIVVLVPDPSYGPKISSVIEAVYSKGLKKPKEEFSVCRFSAGKSEYGGLNQTVQEDGFYQVYIGEKEYRIPVIQGDMFEEMHYDYKDAEKYVDQVFTQSEQKNYNQMIFAFDEKDSYDLPVIHAVREKAYHMKKVEGIDFSIRTPADAAVCMFTHPEKGKVCYAYDNLWGDIVSDAMDLGASIASINSVILLSDGRIWPEMGGAGTAPDLVEKFHKDGYLKYNPVPIIEGLAIGFASASKIENDEDEKLKKYADVLHQAYIDVLKQGFSTPDLVDKLKVKNKTGVDTLSYLKAVRIRMHELLSEDEQAKGLKEKFKNEMREIR